MNKLHYLYKITNQINNKVYIGQTINPIKRWAGHKTQSQAIAPKQIISIAIKKYGANNFVFEVIATCLSYDSANWLEEELIKQHDCLARNGKGYNLSLGGETAPKSDEWKKALQKWRESLSPEERAEISKKQSKATYHQIEIQGHPAFGTKRTDEQRANISAALKAIDKNKIYTEEVRQQMSESHIGYKDSEEVKQKKSESAKLAWENRIDYNRKCAAPDCTVCGKAKYKIIDGVRYCNKHGLRILRYGRLNRIKPQH